MGSNAKKKTTMAKLARESKLRERRLRKEARRDARRHAATDTPVGSRAAIVAAPADPGTA